MKNLYCDIDNTVSSQYSRIKKYYNYKNESKIINSKKLISEDRVINHSVRAINELKKKYNIHWISARPQNLKKTTLKWLQKKKFPIKSITLVNNHLAKINFLKKNKVDLYIDDMKYNYFNFQPELMTNFIKKLNKEKIKYEIFKNNWIEIKKKYL